MHIPKKYFHDKLILLLVSITLFLVLLCCALILLRSSGGSEGVYIVEYRDNQGIHAFKRDGSNATIISFMIFSGIVAATNIALSIKTYALRRTLSVSILTCGILVLTLTVIVSNLLLVYS